MENQTDDNAERELKRRFVNEFLDLLILRLVNTQPAWGYKIIKKTEASYGVKLRHGALYPMLNTLESKGFITSRKDLYKGRVRKTYEITANGKKLLDIFDEFLRDHISQGDIKPKEKTE